VLVSVPTHACADLCAERTPVVPALTATVGVCTDSSSQFPPELAERLGIEVVPLTVTVDDIDRLDGVEFGADDYYASLRSMPLPECAVAAPSPGQFALAYETLLDRGCTSIVSIHGPRFNVLHAARLGAHSTPAPVRLVETGVSGFCMVATTWAAAEMAAAGASLDEITGVPDLLADRAGCFDLCAVPVRGDGAVHQLNSVAATVVAWGDGLRVGVGHSDTASESVADALEAAVAEAASVIEVVRFRLGPTAGEHATRGRAACVVFSPPTTP
jgi:fatty acid-binding protein DegV